MDMCQRVCVCVCVCVCVWRGPVFGQQHTLLTGITFQTTDRKLEQLDLKARAMGQRDIKRWKRQISQTKPYLLIQMVNREAQRETGKVK